MKIYLILLSFCSFVYWHFGFLLLWIASLYPLLLFKIRLSFPYLGFPCGSAGKESTRNAGDLDSITGLGRSFGEGKGYPLQYCGLDNSMDRIVHGVAKSQTWLSDFTHFVVYLKEFCVYAGIDFDGYLHCSYFVSTCGLSSLSFSASFSV